MKRAIYLLLAMCLIGASLPLEAATVHADSPLVIAHRGGRKWAPENTMAAFKRTLESGADGIELDIHRCKSGELVVIHDETVDRTTNGHGFIKDKSWSELKSLDAGSWFDPKFKSESLPLLIDVLRLINGKVLLNVEIKNDAVRYPGIESDLAVVLSKYKYPQKIIVSSFDHDIVRLFHKKAPQYKTAMLDETIPDNVVDYATKDGAYAWNPDFQLLRDKQQVAAHNAGLKVFVWTPNKKDEWERMAACDVDGIITDDPVGLMEALGR